MMDHPEPRSTYLTTICIWLERQCSRRVVR